jgi:hypothetical protein
VTFIGPVVYSTRKLVLEVQRLSWKVALILPKISRWTLYHVWYSVKSLVVRRMRGFRRELADPEENSEKGERLVKGHPEHMKFVLENQRKPWEESDGVTHLEYSPDGLKLAVVWYVNPISPLKLTS